MEKEQIYINKHIRIHSITNTTNVLLGIIQLIIHLFLLKYNNFIPNGLGILPFVNYADSSLSFVITLLKPSNRLFVYGALLFHFFSGTIKVTLGLALLAKHADPIFSGAILLVNFPLIVITGIEIGIYAYKSK